MLHMVDVLMDMAQGSPALLDSCAGLVEACREAFRVTDDVKVWPTY